MSQDHPRPAWAPRVRRHKIRTLYENDAKGICDEALIDDVGYALLARCQSFIAANQARGGEVPCPSCSRIVPHSRGKEEVLRCRCGWEMTWADYFKTIQNKQLSGAEPVLELFRNFVRSFPSARTPRDKMLLIDQLIHGFHWSLRKGHPTRPVAVNLIAGKLTEVMAFLDELTYGNASTPGLKDNLAEWNENIQTAREWYQGADD